MYNEGNINISYYNGNLRVYCKNSSRRYFGKVKLSCEGYITFDNNEQKTFEFNEINKEIVWSGADTGEKWIRGCFAKLNLTHICAVSKIVGLDRLMSSTLIILSVYNTHIQTKKCSRTFFYKLV